MKKLIVAVFVVGLMSLIAAGVAIPPGKNSVSGKVLDKNDTKIVGVDVEAYRQSLSVGKSQSDGDGKYSITFDSGSPIETLRYDHVDWLPATVDNVSGSNDERIFKTLNSRTANLSFSDVQDALSDFDRIQRLDLANNSLRQNFEKFRYRDALAQIQAMIEKQNLPSQTKSELRQRLIAINRTYGITASPAE